MLCISCAGLPVIGNDCDWQMLFVVSCPFRFTCLYQLLISVFELRLVQTYLLDYQQANCFQLSLIDVS